MARILNCGVTPSFVCLHPTSNFAYVMNSNNYGLPNQDSITVLDLKLKIPIATIHDSSFKEPYRMAIHHKGYVCNSASPTAPGEPGTISILCLKTNKVVGTIIGFDGPGGIVISEKKNKAYVSNYGAVGGVGSGNGKTISVVNLKTKEIENTITVNKAPAALTLSPCHSFLYVICYVDGAPENGTLDIISTTTTDQKVMGSIRGFSGPFGIVVSPSCQYAYVTNFGDNDFKVFGTTVSEVDLKNYRITKNIEVGIQPSGIALSEDGKYLFVTTYNALYNDFKNLTYGEGTLTIIRLSQQKKEICKVLSIGQSPSTLTLAKNNQFILFPNYSQNIVQMILTCDLKI